MNAVAAALILADKTDVRRTRVRNRDKATFDIHDRVNYAVEKASTTLDAAGKAVVLDLQLDTGMSAVILKYSSSACCCAARPLKSWAFPSGWW